MSNKKIYAVDNAAEDKTAKFVDLDVISGSSFVDNQEVESSYTVEDKQEIRRADLYMLNGSSITVSYGGSIYVTDGICGCTSVSSGSGDVVDDTTPQLGGNLDLNSSDITGTGNIDINGDISATSVKSNLEGSIHFNAQAAENILEGEVVYVSGISGNTPLVSKARADSSTTMPAFGIASENISLNNTGNIVTLGSQVGLDVSNFGETGIVFSIGDTLYVSSSESGKITNVSPSGESNLIQNIGKIERATPTNNITIKVGGAGRSNATPALDDGNIFIGDSNNRSVTSNLQTLVESYSINNVVDDTTPQLGGSLDVNGNSITSVSNGNVTISPNGTGSLVVNSDIDMGTNSITDVKVGNWDTAYGWGDHSLAGYSTTDTNTFRTVVVGGSTLDPTETLTLTAGTNVSLSESAGTVTISSTYTNTQLSTEEVQDIVGGMVTGNSESNISVTYDDSAGKLTFSAADTNTFRTVVAGGNTLGSTETLTLTAGTNVSITESAGTVTIGSTDTNTQLSTEEVQDIVGGMVTGNSESNISVTYDDSAGKLTFSAADTNTFRTVVAGGNTLGSTETLTLTAGTNVSITESAGTVTIGSTDTNTQLSNEEVQDIVGTMVTGNTEANISVTYDDATGKLNFSAIDTNTQLSTEQVQDIVGAMVSGNTETNISVTYDDATGKLNFSVSADITSVELTGDVGSISDSSGSVRFGINGGEGLETNASGSSISISVSQETEVIDIYDATDPGVNLSTIIQRYGFSDLTLIRSSGTNVRVQIRVDGHYEVGDTIYILNDLYDIEDTDVTIEGVADSAFISNSKGTEFKTCFRSNYPGVALTGYNGQNISRIDFSSVSTSVTSSEAVLLGKSKRIKLVCIAIDENGHSVFSVTKA